MENDAPRRPRRRLLISAVLATMGLLALFALARPRADLLPRPAPTLTMPTVPSALSVQSAVLTAYDSVPRADDRAQVPLDPHLQPVALSGDHYVGQATDGELFLVPLDSGPARQLTTDGAPKWNVVMSQRYIAWLIQAGQRQVTAADGVTDTQTLVHIMVFDRLRGTTTAITTTPEARGQLALSGDRLVWSDKRHERDDFYTHFDLYGFDLATGTERTIAVAPGSQASATISGDLVVWADNRDSPHRGQPLAGCENCPENYFDLYLYNWRTGATRLLVSDGQLNTQPSLDGRRLAWVKPVTLLQSDIYLLEVDTGAITRITNTPERSIAPVVRGSRLVWSVPHPCDMVEIGPDGKERKPPAALYELDLRTEQIRALTGYVGVRYLIDGATTIITEGCDIAGARYVLRGP